MNDDFKDLPTSTATVTPIFTPGKTSKTGFFSKLFTGFLSAGQDLDPSRFDTFIDPTVVVKGEISYNGTLHVAGLVEGNVARGDVRVGKSSFCVVIVKGGNVTGDVEGDHVVVYGTVNGNIKATNVTVGINGTVNGNITYSKLTVAPGASVNGQVIISSASVIDLR